MSKLLTRRIGRSREKQTKVLDQAVNEFRSTVFENNRRNSFRESRPERALVNVVIKFKNFNDDVVRGWQNMRNMPSIIQIRVGSKGLSKKFSFRERRDSCGAIWLK